MPQVYRIDGTSLESGTPASITFGADEVIAEAEDQLHRPVALAVEVVEVANVVDRERTVEQSHFSRVVGTQPHSRAPGEALPATEEGADEAWRALQASAQRTFRDLKMKYLRRRWLEIIAVKA